MRKLLARAWRETDGVLSFEWTVLTSVLTIGAVSGIAAVRDAVQDEMADVAEAMTSLDQSYQVQGPLIVSVHTPYRGGGMIRTRVQEFRRGPAPAATPENLGASSAAGSLFHDSPGSVVRLPQDASERPGPEAQGAVADERADYET